LFVYFGINQREVKKPLLRMTKGKKGKRLTLPKPKAVGERERNNLEKLESEKGTERKKKGKTA